MPSSDDRPFPRRRLLRALPAALALAAGCGGRRPGETEAGTAAGTAASPTPDADTATRPPGGPATRRPGESYETAGGWSVGVSGLRVRRCAVEFGSVHPEARCGTDAQYVLALVTARGEGAPDAADLAVAVEADTLRGRTDRFYVASDDNRDPTAQTYGFPVPVAPPPGEAAVVWRPRGDRGDRPARWPLPAATVADLARVPEFELRGFDLPATAAAGGTVTATVAVANVGDRDGRFLAELGDASLSAQPVLAVDVPAGETVRASRDLEARFGEDDSMTVVLRWAGREERRTVRRATG